jgi:hypothetical protein
VKLVEAVALDIEDVRIGERAVVGKVGVVDDVVQVPLRHGHAVGLHIHSAGFRLAQVLVERLRIGPGKILEQDDDFLQAALDRAGFADDQRGGEEILLLQPEMRVHISSPCRRRREFVVGEFARLDRRPGNVRHAVLAPWSGETVPMKAGRDGKIVVQPHVEDVAFVQRQAVGSGPLGDAVAGRRLAADLDLPGLQTQDLLLAGRVRQARRQRRRNGGSNDE